MTQQLLRRRTFLKILGGAALAPASAAFSFPRQDLPGDIPRILPPLAPPPGALVLFDGRDLSAWRKRSGNGPAVWKIGADGAMTAGGGDIATVQSFGEFTLHVEFNVPPMLGKTGQARGNSGVYLHGRYEIQVLDSYGPALAGKPIGKNDCGAVYDQTPPRVNACLAPGTWQTYDITFRAGRASADRTLEPRVWVLQNNVLIHRGTVIAGPTRAGTGGKMEPTGPILLQDHGNPVRFRNLWLVPHKNS